MVILRFLQNDSRWGNVKQPPVLTPVPPWPTHYLAGLHFLHPRRQTPSYVFFLRDSVQPRLSERVFGRICHIKDEVTHCVFVCPVLRHRLVFLRYVVECLVSCDAMGCAFTFLYRFLPPFHVFPLPSLYPLSQLSPLITLLTCLSRPLSSPFPFLVFFNVSVL